MSSNAALGQNNMPSTDITSFTAHLSKSKRIVALLGAGLSASSGLPTFRGAGGFWRTYDATVLATPNAFRNDPGLVWQFYSYRRHMALNAKPNRAHFALAELARRNADFITLSQNVDNLSPRAGHPEDQLKLLHGNLFDIKCWNKACDYTERNNYGDPIVPALAIPEDQAAIDAMLQQGSKVPGLPFGSKILESHMAQKSALISETSGNNTDSLSASTPKASTKSGQFNAPHSAAITDIPSHPLVRGLDISNASIPISNIPATSLPTCPKCNSLLRPGIVWFGEELPTEVMDSVNEYFSSTSPIDLMLVIGTSSSVYPAAGYTQIAKKKGARIAVVNMEVGEDDLRRGIGKDDWLFQGDAAVLIPEMLKEVVGEMGPLSES